MKRLIDTAHGMGIVVLLDVVHRYVMSGKSWLFTTKLNVPLFLQPFTNERE